ncbi:MAG: hypothetical protein ACOY90_14655 [Candidatus Zhuqueibacterota bacterium]
MVEEVELKFVDPLIFDASVIFNIGHRGELSQVIARLAERYRLLVPPEVVEETQRISEFRQYYHNLISADFEQHAGKVPAMYSDAIIKLATRLGSGELNVIILALDTGGTAVIDERTARKEARTLNIPVTGTLGLLQYAMQQAWLTEQEALVKIETLRANGFRIPSFAHGQMLSEYLSNLG